MVSSLGGVDGRTRALVNLARGLQELGGEARLILVDGAQPDLAGIDAQLVVAVPRRELPTWLQRFRPDLVVVDDDLGALRMMPSIRGAHAGPLIAYALILFGMSAILHQHRDTLEGVGLRRAGRYVPVPLLTEYYARRLRIATGVVAVSETAAKMLRWVYGVNPAGVVHPPISVEDYAWEAAGERDGALVYLGSHPSDTNNELLASLVAALLGHGARVTIFGNRGRSQQLQARFPAVAALHGCPVAELRDAYRRAEVVVCPQHWELFGYVPIEAALVGAPSVSLLGAGCEDVVRDIPDVRFAVGGEDLVAHTLELLGNVRRVGRDQAQHLAEVVSPVHSARTLLASLR